MIQCYFFTCRTVMSCSSLILSYIKCKHEYTRQQMFIKHCVPSLKQINHLVLNFAVDVYAYNNYFAKSSTIPTNTFKNMILIKVHTRYIHNWCLTFYVKTMTYYVNFLTKSEVYTAFKITCSIHSRMRVL